MSSSTLSHLRDDTIQSTGNSSPAEEKTQRQLAWYNRHRRRTAPLKLSGHHRRYLEDEGAFLKLPESTTDALLPIYNTFLDDLIPVIDGREMFRDYSNGHASIFLVRAVCLVACKTKQAASFLQLHDDGPILGQLQFASNLLTGLDAAIKADLEPDRVTKIQILALMHLHNDGLGGVDRSSSYLSQAICEAWSISLHVKVPTNAQQGQCDFLWWSLRNFDRLNKPVMGAAPFIIDDTDIGIDYIAPKQDNYRSQLMAVSVLLGDLMKTATKVYKASSTASVDDCDEFPTLAELTSCIPLDRFHRSHRGYLEIWYHIAAMLSCRYSGPGSIQYNRRLKSAEFVLNIISDEGPDNLPPLPLVPYSLSMSTTVIYRAFRDGVRDPTVVHKDLEICCNNLDSLSQRWTSARGVAKLARRLRRFTNPATFNGPLVNTDDSTHRHHGPERMSGTGTDGGLIISQDRDSGTPIFESSIISVSSLVQPCESPGQDKGADTHNPQGQITDTWTSTDMSYLHLDRAFCDFFDYGMPSVFRDAAMWDFLQAETDQEVSPLPP